MPPVVIPLVQAAHSTHSIVPSITTATGSPTTTTDAGQPRWSATLSHVQLHMQGVRHNRQIGGAVVHLHVIPVVDDLGRGQGAPHRGFQNETMLLPVAPIGPMMDDVALGIDAGSATPSWALRPTLIRARQRASTGVRAAWISRLLEPGRVGLVFFEAHAARRDDALPAVRLRPSPGPVSSRGRAADRAVVDGTSRHHARRQSADAAAFGACKLN